MRYKDYEGPVEGLIAMKLEEIERREHVKILHAIESGSRAWGFASPDSDYDVRFVYVRDRDFYLKLEKTSDVIDWELDEVLDINGWDLTKVLRLMHKSNGTLFEWANSPIVYKTSNLWNSIYEKGLNYFSPKACMYHYYGTAKSNFLEFLQEDMVKYKKYFYVIRPLLACKWIDKYGTPAPVLFDDLKDALLDDDMRIEVDKLLELKMKMNESDKGPKMQIINDYIVGELEHYSDLLKEKESERKMDWGLLNEAFVESLN